MTASDHAQQRSQCFSLAWKGASTDGLPTFADRAPNGWVAPVPVCQWLIRDAAT